MKSKIIDPAEEWLAENWLPAGIAGNPKDISDRIKDNIYHYILDKYNSLGATNPPFDPNLLLSTRKIIETYFVDKSCMASGLLVPLQGGFRLIINKANDFPRSLKRFIIAHEIGHTFFYDINCSVPCYRFNINKSRYWVREGYASEIGGEILMPKDILKKTIRKLGLSPSISSLQKIKTKYDVSDLIAAKQLIRFVKEWDSVIFKSEVRHNVKKIFTKPDEIVKGKSYNNISIPKEIDLDDNGDIFIKCICDLILRASDVRGHIYKNDIKYKKSKYVIETIRNTGVGNRSSFTSCISMA